MIRMLLISSCWLAYVVSKLEIQCQIIELFWRDFYLPFCPSVDLCEFCRNSLSALFCSLPCSVLHSKRAVSYQTQGLKGKMKIAFLFHKKWEVKQQGRQEDWFRKITQLTTWRTREILKGKRTDKISQQALVGDENPRETSCHVRNKLSLITTCHDVSMIALSRKPLTVVRREYNIWQLFCLVLRGTH